MTQPEFTLDWPCGWQTRDERYVVIYCTDAPGPTPIHGRIEGIWRSLSWDENGKIKFFSDDNTLDLINRPAPTVSVPVDKLRDAVFSHPTSGGYIVFETSEVCSEISLPDRPIKWFYLDEVEVSK